MLYDTCNYHILHYSKLIIVHPITTVLIVNLTSKRMGNPVRYCDIIVHRMTMTNAP